MEQLAAVVPPGLDELSGAISCMRVKGEESQWLEVYPDSSMRNALMLQVPGELQRQRPDVQLRVLFSAGPIETLSKGFDVRSQ